jgi:hypothetical protein
VNREQLAHVLRAASQIVDDVEIVVIGSQAILGAFSDDELPPIAMMSNEADIEFMSDPDESKADRVDGAIGEMSDFHTMYGVYGQGVTVETAELPGGWRERVIPIDARTPHRVGPCVSNPMI